MQNSIIYSIGETLMLELEQVDSVSYPEGTSEPNALFLVMKNGEKFQLVLAKT